MILVIVAESEETIPVVDPAIVCDIAKTIEAP